MKKMMCFFSVLLLVLPFHACRKGVNEETLPLVEPEMVFVQGGSFSMGCIVGQDKYKCNIDELPVHQVTLNNFYIGKYEITQGLWKSVMGTSVSQQRDKKDENLILHGEGDDYPMYYVNWDEVQEFISRLNKATGKRYRLPTEAEWEYAARGGNKSKGYTTYSGSNDLYDVADYDDVFEDDDVIYETYEVGRYRSNELGIYNMTGNVWEWCSDWYGTYPSSAQHNPVGPSSGTVRVNRGGGWDSRTYESRVAYRSYNSPNERFGSLGFRLVLSQ